MTCSLKDLRAFAVRNRLDVTFHVHATGAAWMVNRRCGGTPTLGEDRQGWRTPWKRRMSFLWRETSTRAAASTESNSLS